MKNSLQTSNNFELLQVVFSKKAQSPMRNVNDKYITARQNYDVFLRPIVRMKP